MTRFGASTARIETAAAVLRARASRLGASLEAADPTALAAAVVAVDAWLLATGTTSLSQAHQQSPEDRTALSRALLRAAGHEPEPFDLVAVMGEGTGGDRLLGSLPDELAAYERWLMLKTGAFAGDAFTYAGLDLAVPGASPELRAVAWALLSRAADLGAGPLATVTL